MCMYLFHIDWDFTEWPKNNISNECQHFFDRLSIESFARSTSVSVICFIVGLANVLCPWTSWISLSCFRCMLWRSQRIYYVAGSLHFVCSMWRVSGVTTVIGERSHLHYPISRMHHTILHTHNTQHMCTLTVFRLNFFLCEDFAEFRVDFIFASNKISSHFLSRTNVLVFSYVTEAFFASVIHKIVSRSSNKNGTVNQQW